MTTATIATTPKNTTPTTLRSTSGFALPSVIHNNQHQPTSPIGFLFLKLLPPPCAVLLVYSDQSGSKRNQKSKQSVSGHAVDTNWRADKKLWMHTSDAACIAILTISSGFPGFPGFHSSLWQERGTTTANLLPWSCPCRSTATDSCDMLRSFATENTPSLLVSHAVTDLTTPHHDYLILLCTCVGRGKQRLSRDTSLAYCKDLASEADWQTSAISGNFWPDGCILKMSASKCEKFPLERLIIEAQALTPAQKFAPNIGLPVKPAKWVLHYNERILARTWREISTVLPNQKATRYLLCRHPFLKTVERIWQKYMLQANMKVPKTHVIHIYIYIYLYLYICKYHY